MVKAFGIWMNAVRRGARVAVLSAAAALVMRWSHVAAAVPPPPPAPTPAGR